MDALTFASPILIRKMTFANASKAEVQQINYAKAIEGLELTHDQFVDMCILLGCDYCDTIKGIGPKTALKLIKEHGCIENILKTINREKYTVPESYEPNEARKRKEEEEEGNNDDNNEEGKPKEEEEELVPVYVEARKLFNQHEVMSESDIDPLLKWKECQPEPLKAFLVDECGFNPDRVQSSIEKLQKAHKATSKPQMRMDEFFKVKPNPNKGKNDAKKRKAEADKKNAAKGKKGKGGGFYKKK